MLNSGDSFRKYHPCTQKDGNPVRKDFYHDCLSPAFEMCQCKTDLLLINTRNHRKQMEQEFMDALMQTYTSKEQTILDVILDPEDISPHIFRLCQKFSQGVKQ